jgi:hypothetical protein
MLAAMTHMLTSQSAIGDGRTPRMSGREAERTRGQETCLKEKEAAQHPSRLDLTGSVSAARREVAHLST